MENKFTEIEINKFHIEIGKKVKEEREKRNITQLELSLSMGYKSVSLVSAAELTYKGKHFNLEQLYKISKILNLSIHDLIPNN